MGDLKIEALRQIDRALAFYDEWRPKAKYDDLSDLPRGMSDEMRSIMAATLIRLAPPESVYLKTADGYPDRLAGSLRALRRDYDDGLLEGYQSLIRGDIFADFLEMAQHLLEAAYKDPAAVLIGSVLGSHLRALCVAKGIEVEPDGRPLKADRMNAELVKMKVYGKLDQKSVTAWLDLRNSAAHGKFELYTQDQVQIMLGGVREFMSRVAAA